MANERSTTSVESARACADVREILTPRLCLRDWLVGDEEALFQDMSDPELMAWWSREPFASIDELRQYFARRPNGWRGWGITKTGEDLVIGFVVSNEKRGGVSEIGYLLSRRAQRQGFAKEAVAALVDQLFAEGQRRIFADCDPENHASIGLLERLGFQLEGRLRAEWKTHMGERDSLIYGLLASEWPVASRQSVLGQLSTPKAP